MTLHWKGTGVEVHKVVVGPYENNVFTVRCTETGDALLIDAANEHEQLLELCQSLGVRTVVETHGHWDHIQAVPAIRDAGYEVGVATEDATMLPSYDFILEDDSVIEVGRLRIRTIHNPGHTPGSMSFVFEKENLLIAGDTLFQGSIGRTDLWGGDYKKIEKSIRTVLYQLDEETKVITGHGESTTIGREIRTNAFVRG